MESLQAFNVLKCNQCGKKITQTSFERREPYRKMRERARSLGWRCWDRRDYDLCADCEEPKAPENLAYVLTEQVNRWQDNRDECRVKALADILPYFGFSLYYEDGRYRVGNDE